MSKPIRSRIAFQEFLNSPTECNTKAMAQKYRAAKDSLSSPKDSPQSPVNNVNPVYAASTCDERQNAPRYIRCRNQTKDAMLCSSTTALKPVFRC